MGEEYDNLGLVWFLTGEFLDEERILKTKQIFSDKNTPHIFRPPGYAFFVATSFKVFGLKKIKSFTFESKEKADDFLTKMHQSIYYSQAIVLGIAACFLFLWIKLFTSTRIAFISSLLFGCNIYSIILVGLFHYDVVHIFSVIISGYVLDSSIKGNQVNPFTLFFSGILWGICTLIRPLTLILPFVICIAFLICQKNQFYKACTLSGIFILGMLCVISPYTLRNYHITHKFIPVNAQGSIILWAATTPHSRPEPNHYNWSELRFKMKEEKANQLIDKEFSGRYYANRLKLEEEFRKLAFENFRKQPQVYFKNFSYNFFSFMWHMDSVRIKIFQALQDPSINVEIKKWLMLENKQDFYSSNASNIFNGLIYLLTLLSYGGMIYAAKLKDRQMIIPIMIYLCFCIAHSLTFIDLMYYYIKLPFLFIFSAYCLDKMTALQLALPFVQKKVSIASICICLCIVLVISLNCYVFK